MPRGERYRRISLRFDLLQERHKNAWDILTAEPEGTRNKFIIDAITRYKDFSLEDIRKLLRENIGRIPVSHIQPEDKDPDNIDIPDFILDDLINIK
jgi:hypothetical protein